MTREIIGDHTLICADCFDAFGEIADRSVDMILADLPYGTTQNTWDCALPLPDLWREFARLCGGAIVLTAIQPFASALVASRPDAFRDEWIWEKNKASGHLNAKKKPMRAHENVLVFSFGALDYFPQMTEGHRPGNFARRVGWSSNYGAQVETTYGGQTVRYPRTVQQFDVVNNDSADRAHPTQKPVDMMRYFIRTYTKPGDVVLDNTMGSGTTCVAAALEGRRSIGIERERKYFDIAVDRVKAALIKADEPVQAVLL